MPYYVTYKFYDSRKRRLAIFAIPTIKVVDAESLFVGNGPIVDTLHIYVIACSRKDTFSKKKAKALFEEFIDLKRQGFDGGMAHPIELQIDVKDDKPKFTFLRWCEDNYFKYRNLVYGIETNVLIKGEEILDLDLNNGDLWELVEEQEDREQLEN